jgi:hypothetical protein
VRWCWFSRRVYSYGLRNEVRAADRFAHGARPVLVASARYFRTSSLGGFDVAALRMGPCASDVASANEKESISCLATLDGAARE